MSDAQQVRAGTSPTGKLRLTQSEHDINHRTYFRHEFFGQEIWETEVRRDGNTYEVAHIEFRVSVRGRSLGTQVLVVDHAMHREAGQGNVVTVLAWGGELGRMLRRRSHVGQWVVLERTDGGQFLLTIQGERPDWAP